MDIKGMVPVFDAGKQRKRSQSRSRSRSRT